MEASDAADTIQEAAEDVVGANEQFRKRAAIIVGVLAMLLAIASLGGDNATKETINANILASDTWAFYQAKNVRQTSVQLAAEELEALLVTQPTLAPEARAQLQQRIDTYRATVARYETEPSTGEGKQELLAKARDLEARREHGQAQDPNFDYAAALYQIGIVLGSVSIVSASHRLLWLALALGLVATLLLINGFFLIVHLPIG